MMPVPRLSALDLLAVVGLIFWVGLVGMFPVALFGLDWPGRLMLLAPLVLVPWTTEATTPCRRTWSSRTRLLLVPAGLCLAMAFTLPPGLAAVGWAMPWIVCTTCISLAGLLQLLHRPRPYADVGIAVGALYLGVGGAWLLADRLAMSPLGFDPIIVLLTSVHFHFAGFLLPTLTGLTARELPGRCSALAVALAIVGVPLVAFGITATKLGWSVWFETITSQALALGGILTALLHLRLAFQTKQPAWSRACWFVAGVSLLVGMILAMLFGLRFALPFEIVDIPWMQATHGTLNAVGFGYFGVLGWRLRGASTIQQTHGTSDCTDSRR